MKNTSLKYRKEKKNGLEQMRKSDHEAAAIAQKNNEGKVRVPFGPRTWIYVHPSDVTKYQAKATREQWL